MGLPFYEDPNKVLLISPPYDDNNAPAAYGFGI